MSKHKGLIDWTGERYVPWVDLGTPEIHYEHLHRYYFASQFVAGKKVLDLASGEGYGCAIMAEKAAEVIGVELDENAVKHAASRYPLPNVRFIEGSITEISIPGEEIFDIITCFEAIEHIEDHNKLLAEAKRLLKEDGLFIISSPNRLLYSDEPGYKNPYHVRELYFDEFRELLVRYFPYVCFLGQKVLPVSSIWPLGIEEGILTEVCIRKADTGFIRVGVQEKHPLYFIAIASKRQLPEGLNKFSTLTDVSEELFSRLRQMIDEREQQLAAIKQEYSLEKDHLKAQIAEKERTVIQLEENLNDLRKQVIEKEAQIFEKKQRILQLEENLTDLSNRLSMREEEFLQERERLQAQVVEREQTIIHLEESITELRKQLVEKDTEILLMRSSLGWFIIERYRRFADTIFPVATRRRVIYELSQKALKTLITAGPVVLARKIKNRLIFGQHKKAQHSCLLKGKEVNTSLTDDFAPFTLPEVDHPKVSIIIPVFNKWVYTYNCLRSVAQNTEGVPYEVIIVDNASQDETRSWLNRIKGIRVIRNTENEGFVAACNKGSQAAHGEYLVFLNNDVIVKPGWLSELIRTFESDAHIGVVGAKLLYPDGSLQEAGGIIWRDGTGWNYGRGDRPDKPDYNFLREVDYCSGACLAVKREVFEALGGFDVRYQPAYYEDSDLCFAARNLGFKVVYQPKAEVIHFEGVTAGRDESRGIKAFQAVNRPKFVEKWREVLQECHWPSQPGLVWRARRHGKRPEVLMVDHYVPEWDKDSGSFYMRQMIQLFSELGWNITFYPDNLVALQPYTAELQQLGVEVVYGPTNFETFLKERANQFDLALLRRPDFSYNKIDLIRRFSPNTRIIYDTADLHFVREERRAAIEGSQEARLASERYKAMELYLAKTADVTFVVTEEERQHLLRLDPTLNVVVIPNIHPVPERNIAAFEERSGLLFLGSYLHPPNVDGVKWFVAEIWPLIRRELPEVEFYVVGSNVPEDVKRLEKVSGVRVIGWVPDVVPWFDKCRVFVSPLRYGAGMKGKIGHAMSYGLPVVTTTIGAEGIGLTDGETALIRDDPEGFAQAVVELYCSRDLWVKVSQKSIEHIEKNYSPRAVLSRLSSVLQRLGCHFPALSQIAVKPMKGVAKYTWTCNICGHLNYGGIEGPYSLYREGILCEECGSISRDRMVIHILGEVLGFSCLPLIKWPRNPQLRILETSGCRAHPHFLERLYDYYNTFYDPEQLSKSDVDHRRYADVQALPYGDESFDVVISSDVFEHVRDDDKGFQEILRVLKPGGVFILTVPFLGLETNTIIRVQPSSSGDIYLMPPEYHGSPEGGALVYRIYGGKDLVPKLRMLGFDVKFVEAEYPNYGISLQNALLCTKVGCI